MAEDRAAESFASAPKLGDGGGASGSSSVWFPEAEKRASIPSTGPTPPLTSTLPSPPAVAAPPKTRSCVVCRTRKVRCNKESPCSNCLRAGIPCVIPSADRPPRWARRLERVAHNAAAEERLAQAARPPTAQVMERLRNLESLVKDLSSQLEQAHAAANSSAGNSPASSHDRDGDNQRTAAPIAATSSMQSRFGRLVLNDASRSRYVSSGFWSRVNDEVGLFNFSSLCPHPSFISNYVVA